MVFSPFSLSHADILLLSSYWTSRLPLSSHELEVGQR